MATTTTAITVERLNQILEEREKERQLAPPPPPQEVTSTPQGEPELVSVTSTVVVKETNGNGLPKVDLSIWENVIDLPTETKPEPKPQPQNGSTNGNPTGRKMNAAGMRILKECEGLYLNSYKCPAGVWTIGYGCTKGIRPGMTISEAEAEEMLRKELTEFEKGVERILSHIPLNENQFSALVSLTYNCGMEPITEGMTIRRKLEARDYRGAAEGFLLWNKGGGRVLPGLVKRREMEKKLFLTEV